MWCHVAVPHGWKNKSLLVNLNDVGPEVMCREVDRDNAVYDLRTVPNITNSTQRNSTNDTDRSYGNDNEWSCVVGKPIPAGSTIPRSALGGSDGYNNPPYYVNARLKVTNFKSGSWSDSDCGGKSGMQSTCDRGAGF